MRRGVVTMKSAAAPGESLHDATPEPTGLRRSTVITPDGARLAVWDSGNRDAARTVVFLHGFCLTHQSWARHLAYLKRLYGNDIRVIAYDHRGHGQSGAAPMVTYTIDQLADDLAHILSTLEVAGHVVVVGHSMGAMTALAYLARPAGARPIDPRGLVLVATAAGKLAERGVGRLLAMPVIGPLFGFIDHTPELALKALSSSMRAALGRFTSAEQGTTAALAAVTLSALASTSLRTAVGFLPALRAYDLYCTLRDVVVPSVIVVSGLADVLTPAQHGMELAAGIAGAEHLQVPGGHMLPQEAPAVIDGAIRKALNIKVVDVPADEPAPPTMNAMVTA